MSIRDKREAAFWPLWRRWGNEPREFLAHLLDEYDAIDRDSAADGFMAGLAATAPVPTPDITSQAENTPADDRTDPVTAAEVRTPTPPLAKPPAARTATTRRPAARKRTT